MSTRRNRRRGSRNAGKKQFDEKLSMQDVNFLQLLKETSCLSQQDVFDRKILHQKDQLIVFLEKAFISADNVVFLLSLMLRICKSTQPNVIALIPTILHSSLMSQQLTGQLLKWSASKDKKLCWSVAVCCMAIYEKCLSVFPATMRIVSLDALQNFVSYLADKTLLEKMNAMTKQHYEICQSMKTNHMKHINTRSNSKYTSHMPVDDFRRLSTMPVEHDVTTRNSVPLRPLKVNGCYESGEEYLDIQYRLIREDLIGPLRDRTKGLQNGECQLNELDVYKGVQILYPICTYNGITYKIRFDNTRFRGFPWQYSKRLIFGSLLCFTKDNFRTCIFGTVADRSVPELNQGYLTIRFPNNKELYSYIADLKYLRMIECPSFFEAYRHVLDCLKELNPVSIPFHKYVVDCETEIGMPKYLLEHYNQTFDLYGALGTDAGRKVIVPIRNLREKRQYDTDLNESQLDAIKHALTSEFAIIQGPPGTGKTFSGLRIAHCLLTNQQLWNESKKHPMLIVCYTNHALDQFLQGLVDYGHENIIRVGGRLSEEMQKYSMQNAIQKFRTKCRKNNSHAYIRYMRNMTFEARDNFAKDLGPYMSSVKRYKEAVSRGRLVSYIDLKHCIDAKHTVFFDEQENHCLGLNISIFDIFLDLCKIPLSILYNVSNINEENEHEEGYADEGYYDVLPHEEDSKELIDVFGEGNALLDRWVFDETEYKAIEDDSGEQPTVDHNNNNSGVKDCFVDADGFRLVTKTKREKEREVRHQLQDVEAMTTEEVDNVVNPWMLKLPQRWRLYKHWLDIFMQNYNDFIELRMQQYEDTCQEATYVREKEHEIILQEASVIAMTTTCASRYRHVLQNIKPKIVIIEEAAEVLEAHVISSLVKETEHCILIGDHKQLRPNPSKYELAKDYNLELSLFERMVNNGMKCPMLNMQHRMRPSISLPLRHIYPMLQDHESVSQYDDIKGVTKNVFFLNHGEPEQNVGKFASKANPHEAAFVKSLCLYFLQQGYDPTQITVLTGYSGQLMHLRSIMPKDIFEGVKVTCVDNFQGEENDIILLSLVRSNARQNIGFLKTENRVCVSLSRAKKGFYVIGNFDLLSSECDLWRSIVDDMKAADAYGTELALVCQNHAERLIFVSKEEDFEQVPEGGCEEICNYQLPCLHSCDAFCHPYDAQHEVYVCREKCLKVICDVKDHYCTQRCHLGFDCSPCSIPVEKYFPLCGHNCLIPCSVESSETVCTHPCENILQCGHVCPKTCGEECIEASNCTTLTEKVLKCHHRQYVECNTKVVNAICVTACCKVLECGHMCNGNCDECYTGNDHIRCNQPCKKILACLHQCQGKCGRSCLPCKETSCNNHLANGNDEGQCEHVNTDDHQPFKGHCDEICSKILSCEHPCSSLCGERCFCIYCAEGIEDDEQPYIILDCNHISTVATIDQLVQDVIDGELITLPQCPACRAYIRYVTRYKNTSFKPFIDNIKTINKFCLSKEKDEISKITKVSYQTCVDIARILMQGYVKLLTKRDRIDFQKIIDDKLLGNFKRNLDLRYLSRSESKSYLLLITERLVKCDTILEAYILSNQIQLLHYVYKCFEHAHNAGKLDGLQHVINERLGSLLGNLTDNHLSFQQIYDLHLEAQTILLHLQTIICQKVIRRLKKTSHNAKLSPADKALKCVAKLLTCEFLTNQSQYDTAQHIVKEVSDEFAIEMRHVNDPVFIGRTYDQTDRKWYRCPNGHIHSTLQSRNKNMVTECPKCDHVTVGESTGVDVSLHAPNDLFDITSSSSSSLSCDDVIDDLKDMNQMVSKFKHGMLMS